MTTLSFHKVMFSAEEVLDLISDYIEQHFFCECDGLSELEGEFAAKAEERSRS